MERVDLGTEKNPTGTFYQGGDWKEKAENGCEQLLLTDQKSISYILFLMNAMLLLLKPPDKANQVNWRQILISE